MIIKTIYNLEPECEAYNDIGVCKVYLTFQGERYCGTAQLAPEDSDFFSEKVGLNIALSRARIVLLKDLIKQTKIAANIKYQMYQEAIEYGKKSPGAVDPTEAFLKKAIKAQTKYDLLRHALKKEQRFLAGYLENQDKMVERVRLYRVKAKTE